MDTPSPEEFSVGLITKGGRDSYLLPEGVGDILEVNYVTREEEPFLVFEFPTTKSYLALVSSNGSPSDAGGVRRVLRDAHKVFSYSPVWFRLRETLFVYPIPVNDGEFLRLRCLPSIPQPTAA